MVVCLFRKVSGDASNCGEELQSCEPPSHAQGSKSPKSPKSVKEGFGAEKPPFPMTQEKRGLSQKIPIFSVVPCREMGIF